MEDCLFCKIMKGEIPCKKIYEDADIFSFLDVAPINKGHALVIPKIHHETFLQTPDDVLQKMVPVIKNIAAATKKALNADGINLGLNNGSAAGQIIFHTHFHLIPRFENDGLQHWPKKSFSEQEMEEFQKKIQSFLK